MKAVRWRLLLGVVLAAGLVVLCVGALRTFGRLGGAHPGDAAVAAAAAAFGNVGVCSARWRALQLPKPGLASVCRRYVEAVYFSVLVPGGLAGDVYRSTAGDDRPRAAAAVIAERAVGGIVTLVVATPLLFMRFGAKAGAAGLTALGLVAAVTWFGLRSRPRIHVRLAALETALRETASRPRALGAAVLLSLVYLLAFWLFLYMVVHAVGAPVAPGTALLATPLVALSGMLPSVSGVSPSHALIAALVATSGGGPVEAAAAVALAYVITLMLAVVGGASLVHRTRRATARLTTQVPAVAP